MREIQASALTEVVKRLCIEANCHLPKDMQARITEARAGEDWPGACEILDRIIENYTIADERSVPICQDTGVACVFLEIGQDVHVSGSIADAVNEGVRQGYSEGYLRKSVVRDPLNRVNTSDNTPAMIYYDLVPGDAIRITVAPKGFGSENMSALKMLTPAATEDDVVRFVVDTVIQAGANPCPPITVGVGIGGDFERCAAMAKECFCRPLDAENSDPRYRALEARLLREINQTNIGPQGFSGDTTALSVKVAACPTHIAGLPVAVNINCHVTRHAETTI